jgi:hypothetical protein
MRLNLPRDVFVVLLCGGIPFKPKWASLASGVFCHQAQVCGHLFDVI